MGVIGAGSMGRNHIRVYKTLRDLELVGVADPDGSARPVRRPVMAFPSRPTTGRC